MKFLTVLVSFQFSIASHVELYSENSYLSREKVYPNFTEMRINFLSFPLRPVLFLGTDLTVIDRELNRLDNGSFAFVAPGLKYSISHLSFSISARFRRFYRPLLVLTDRRDYRGLLVYDQELKKTLGQSQFSFFLQSYTEALYTSADDNNVIFADYLRLGLSRSMKFQLKTDVFFEPFVTIDRLGHFYNNRFDFKVSLRLNHSLFKLGMSQSLSLSYIWNRYFNYADLDHNPYKKSGSSFRIMYVLGVS